jgi:hypothetical protein
VLKSQQVESLEESTYLDTWKALKNLKSRQRKGSKYLYTLSYRGVQRGEAIKYLPVTFYFCYRTTPPDGMFLLIFFYLRYIQVPLADTLVDDLLKKKTGVTEFPSSSASKFKLRKRNENSSPKFFPTQIAVAKTILDKMRSKFEFRNYDRFDYLIVTPPRKSLFQQTCNRLDEVSPHSSSTCVITAKSSQQNKSSVLPVPVAAQSRNPTP